MALPEKRFRRRIEDFKCERCGSMVRGTGYTDHCPRCLTGKHVDVNPGDRGSDCGGLMTPVGAEYRRGQFIISYVCERCGILKRVNAAEDDDKDLLVELSAKPRKP